jgi:phospholipase/carboxylesterase
VITTRVHRGAAAERLLVLVHGLGADENDLAGTLPHLDPEGRFVTVLPRGPLGFGPGYAWFPFGAGAAEAIESSLAALEAVVEQACAEHGFERDEVVLGGFSQGAAMVIRLGLGRTPRPAGVLAMSGFLVGEASPLVGEGPWPPVLVQHGSHDPMVPVERGRHLARSLAAEGVPTVYREYPMQHQVALESIADARAWLDAVRAGEAPDDGFGGRADRPD